jgi:hypothetical protein
MPTLQEILQRKEPERRSVGRTRINRNALLFFAGQTGVFSCYVRDATNQGAGIRLEGLNVLPVDFDLSFDNFRTTPGSRVIWQEGDFVGIAFKLSWFAFAVVDAVPHIAASETHQRS